MARAELNYGDSIRIYNQDILLCLIKYTVPIKPMQSDAVKPRRWCEALYIMNPIKVKRDGVKELTDLPNIGKSMAEDLRTIGIIKPEQLIGRSPYEMYEELCSKTGSKHDPCVIDVFLSITRFIEGDNPRPWWEYTAERKRALNGS